MPRFDKTGPSGNGSQTGRGMGKCNSGAQTANNPSEDEKGVGKRKRDGSCQGNGKGQGAGGSSGMGKGRRSMDN